MPRSIPGDENLHAELEALRTEVEKLRVAVRRREAVERALEESEERHRAFIAASSEAIWRVEFDAPIATDIPEEEMLAEAFKHGYIAECNDAMARMYGFDSASDFVGARLGSMLDRDDPKNLQMFRALRADGFRVEAAESHELDRDGNPRIFLNNIVGIVDGARLVRLWGTQRDITESRRLEEELRQSAKMEALGRLAAGLAHDYNNLLTAIVGHAEMAEERVQEAATAVRAMLSGDAPPDDPDGSRRESMDELCLEVKTDIEEIRLAALRASSLTRQLLSFTRKQVVQPVVMNLNVLIARSEKLLRRLLPEDVDIVQELAAELWSVRADPGQIEQVLMNLAVNARDAMPSGGRLQIRTSNVTFSGDDTIGFAGEHVLVSVSDTGGGMDDDIRQHLFEPYFTTKEMGRGTGLGLATCHAIVTQSGGRIEVSSMPQRGTTFRIFLPRAAGVPEPQALPEPVTSPAGSETVLVVEDEAAVRALAVRFLRSHGYIVLDASNGLEALAVAADHDGRIDLLVTDMVMPRMGGSELAKKIEQSRRGIRVLYTSGFPERGMFDADGDLSGRFLPKPYSLADLARHVRTILDAE